MSMALIASGHQIKIKANLFLVGNLYDYAQWLLTTPEIKFTFKNPKENDVILCSEEKKYLNSVFIDFNFYSRKIKLENEIIVPFSMHPSVYRNNYLSQIRVLQNIKKSISIFFSGSFSNDYYNSPLLHLYHQMDTRMELLTELKANNSLNIFYPKNRIEAFTAIEEDSEKIIIINRSEAPIYPNEWLPILAKAHFFIAFPGTTIPFCHNIVEALSVGSIPILAYAHQMPKGLIDGINCLIYNDKNNFIEKLHLACNMNSTQKNEMSKSAIRYYNDILHHIHFADNILKFKPKKVYANVEFVSLQHLDVELGTNHTETYSNG
jgi:hypothetical protein